MQRAPVWVAVWTKWVAGLEAFDAQLRWIDTVYRETCNESCNAFFFGVSW